jgi:hypothetical protein
MAILLPTLLFFFVFFSEMKFNTKKMVDTFLRKFLLFLEKSKIRIFGVFLPGKINLNHEFSKYNDFFHHD